MEDVRAQVDRGNLAVDRVLLIHHGRVLRNESEDLLQVGDTTEEGVRRGKGS